MPGSTFVQEEPVPSSDFSHFFPRGILSGILLSRSSGAVEEGGREAGASRGFPCPGLALVESPGPWAGHRSRWSSLRLWSSPECPSLAPRSCSPSPSRRSPAGACPAPAAGSPATAAAAPGSQSGLAFPQKDPGKKEKKPSRDEPLDAGQGRGKGSDAGVKTGKNSRVKSHPGVDSILKFTLGEDP